MLHRRAKDESYLSVRGEIRGFMAYNVSVGPDIRRVTPGQTSY
jgi:hypothetical protein